MNCLSILIPGLIFYLGYKEKTKNKKYLYFAGAVIVLICMNKNIIENFSLDPLQGSPPPPPDGFDEAAFRLANSDNKAGHLDKIFKFKNSSNNYFYLGRIDDNLWSPTNVYTKSYIAPFYNYFGSLFSTSGDGTPRTDWLESYNTYFEAAVDPASPAYGGNPNVPVVISFGTADSTVSGTIKDTIKPTPFQGAPGGIGQHTDDLRGKNNIFCSKTKDISDPAVGWDREDIGRVVWKEGALSILQDAAATLTYDSSIDLFDCQDVSIAEMVEEQVGAGQGSNVSQDGSCTTSANCSEGKKCYLGTCRSPSELERDTERNFISFMEDWVDDCKSSLVDTCMLVDSECKSEAVEGDQETNGKCNRPNPILDDKGVPICPFGYKKLIPNSDPSTSDAMPNIELCYYEFRGLDWIITHWPYWIVPTIVVICIIGWGLKSALRKPPPSGTGGV
jgi:hypothetical protein